MNNSNSGFAFGQQNFTLQPQQQQQQQPQQQQQMFGMAGGGTPSPQVASHDEGNVGPTVSMPQTREELSRMYQRWQTLKSELGEEAMRNQEFIEIQRILRQLSQNQRIQRSQQQHQQQQSQQQQQQQQQPIPQRQSSQSPFMQQRVNAQQSQFTNGGGSGGVQTFQGQNQFRQMNSATSTTSPMNVPSPASPQTSAGPNRPQNMPPLGPNSPFNSEQMAMLRNQMIAFKALSKNVAIPPQVQSALFSKSQQQTPRPQGQQTPIPQPGQGVSSPAMGSNNASTPIAGPGVPASENASPQQRLVAPMAKSVKQILGVEGFVDPYSYLASSVPFETLSQRQQQLFVPAIMPVGLDVQEMKLNREKSIVSSMNNRINELTILDKNSAEVAEDDEELLSQLIELKALRLVNVEKALRGHLLSTVYHFNKSGVDEMNRVQFLRMRRPDMQDAVLTERFDQDQRHQRIQRENEMRTEYLNKLRAHCETVIAGNRQHRQKGIRLGKAVASYHTLTEKEEQKRMERTAKQRLQALKANDEEAYIKLLDQTKDTRITHLLKQTNQFLKSLAEAVKSQQRETKGIRADEFGGGENGEEDADENIDYYAVAHRIKEDVTKQPNILVGGTLKEYQIKGLQWMVSLYNNNLNGILADEMGLGKTIQTISLITYLIETKKHPGPYLVIVPLSTLTNWTLEFEKWAPSVKKIVYKGPPMARKAQQNAIKAGDFQVLLTTYEYIIKDKAILSRIRWIHMIIDEGHRMKNAQSKLSSTLTQFYTSKYRLILTGTPLQNNLPELWALLNFVLPKIFNSVKSFDEWFNTPFANTGSQDKMDLSEEETLLIIRRLHKVLRPFLLRRLKKDVEKDLPDKVEKVIKCKMSSLQSKLYQQMVKHKVIFLGEGAQGATTTGLKGLNNQIMQLRKICNHPFVFEEVENLVNPSRTTNDDLWRVAGKFELLDRILPKFKATGHRVLLFFQMTQIMDIMEDFLRLRGMRYLRLDGGTKAEDRSQLLKLYNAENSPYFAFLLSTRAGGLGLNLQSADTVIIYDTDWNPHQDLQAQDRAHRIGQTKEVRILRLITETSVEENILERAHQKLEIDGKVIQAGKFDNKSTSEEQEAFLRSLLEAEEAKRSQKDDDDDDLDDEELNEILARNDGEREIFRALDIKRIQEDQYRGRRLLTEEELPEVYKQDIVEHLKPEPIEHYGRGARERKVTHYDDGLTEEQWLEAVDNDEDTLEEAIARKRARVEKRRAKKLKRGFGDSPGAMSDNSPVATPESPLPINKRKRGRKPRTDIDTSLVDDVTLQQIPPRKKAKGRPPKIKETLAPEQRQELTNKLQILYDHVLNVMDEETGRSRIDLFLELPAKRIYPDYYLLIQNPIACEQILKRINNNTYQKLGEFLADFKLMFDNARTYNEEHSLVYDDANVLEKALHDKVAELVPQAAHQLEQLRAASMKKASQDVHQPADEPKVNSDFNQPNVFNGSGPVDSVLGHQKPNNDLDAQGGLIMHGGLDSDNNGVTLDDEHNGDIDMHSFASEFADFDNANHTDDFNPGGDDDLTQQNF